MTPTIAQMNSMASSLTLEDCIPYQCGSDPGNLAMVYACSQAGFSGVRSCADPTCAPYCPDAQIQSAAAPAPKKSTGTPAISKVNRNAIHQAGVRPMLTPQNIVAPLPDITRALQPMPTPVHCSDWDQLNMSIANYPLIAAGILGLAFFVFWKGGR
jgi:hypothetical protein